MAKSTAAPEPQRRLRETGNGFGSSPPHPMYPVVLRLAGRRCLVVGGGSVAARKVTGLARCGASVTVIAPELGADMERLSNRLTAADDRAPSGQAGAAAGWFGSGQAGDVTIVRRGYAPGDAGNYRLVITATGTPSVDRAVAVDADRAGVWVNSADDPDHCSFYLPSVHRDGPVTVAVSTSGLSPALASWLRRKIADELVPGAGRLAQLFGDARTRLRSAGRSTGDVRWSALLDAGLLDQVGSGDLEGARQAVDQALRSVRGAGHGAPIADR